MSHQSRWASLKEPKGQDDANRGPRSTSSQRPGSQQSRWANVTPTQPTSERSSADTSAQQQVASSRNLTPPVGLSARSSAKPLGGKALDRMALLASPSRGLDASSSLSADLLAQGSMDLTDFHVQAEFRSYISSQIASRVIPALRSATPSKVSVLDSASYLPHPGKSTTRGSSKAEEELQQVVLLIRKLREAVVASKRRDTFVVDVYRLSVYLALLCMDVPQLSTSLPRLVLELLPIVESSSSGATDSDLVSILQHTRAQFDTKGFGDERASMASLMLLQTLCLSGRATRLGQYANGTSTQSASSLPSSSVSLREYKSQRAQLATLYPESASQFQLCDEVYAIVRDSDPFLLARLLERPQLDIWQRILLMQLIPTIRAKAWTIARKAYMYLPISSSLALKLNPHLQPTSESSTGSNWLMSSLLLADTYLPVSSSTAAQKHSTTKTRYPPPPPPDDWEEDDPTSLVTKQLAQTSLQQSSIASAETEARITDFLKLELGSDGDIAQRVMQIREGFAFKIR